MKNKHTKQPKQSSVPTKQKPKPEWVTSFVDYSQFQLTPAEQVKKKVALISKHRQQAKDEVRHLQEKLALGIHDDETSKIFETALSAKGLGHDKYGVTRRNLSQMMHYEESRKKEKSYGSSSVYSTDKENIHFQQDQAQEKKNREIHKEKFKTQYEDVFDQRSPPISSDISSFRQGQDVEKLIKDIIEQNRQEISSFQVKQPQELFDKSGVDQTAFGSILDKDLIDIKKPSITYSQKNHIIDEIERSPAIQLETKQNITIIPSNNISSFHVRQPQELFDRTQINNQPRIEIEPQILVDKYEHENKRLKSLDLTCKNIGDNCKTTIFDGLRTDQRLLEPMSPSKFFQYQPPPIQEAQITFQEEKPIIDIYDLDQLRNMLENTRQELEKMNITTNNSSFNYNPINRQQLQQQGQPKQQSQFGFSRVLPNVTQEIIEPDEDIQPRQLAISQHQLRDNLKAFTKKYKQPNSFNIYDNI